MKWLPVLRSADCLEDFLLFKKPGTKSVALNYFGSKADESGKVLAKGEDRSVCRSHKKAVLAKGGTTTNLHPFTLTRSPP